MEPVPLTADEQEAARLVWRVYGPLYDAFNDEMGARFRDHVELGVLFADAVPTEQPETRAAIEAAFIEGDWERYWRHVRELGVGYAQTDASLCAWFELVNWVRSRLTDEIFAAYGADPDTLRSALWALGRWLDDAMGLFAQSFVDASQHIVERQQQAIRALSTPVLQVAPQILVLPIIGLLDRDRVRRLGDAMLGAVAERRARAVVLDLTGVPDMDTVSASALLQIVGAARLMGADVIASGISSDMAQALVTVGVDLSEVTSVGDLESGLERAQRIVGRNGRASERQA